MHADGQNLAEARLPLRVCRRSLQPPAEALAVKRAKLELLQARAREKLARAARVAEPEVLAACLVSAPARGGRGGRVPCSPAGCTGQRLLCGGTQTRRRLCPSEISRQAVARDAELGRAATAAIEAAAEAAARLRAAAAGEDKAELQAALRGFEVLCRPGAWAGVGGRGAGGGGAGRGTGRPIQQPHCCWQALALRPRPRPPGRPDGPTYTAAAEKLRRLVREELERGWRCAAAAAAAAEGDAPHCDDGSSGGAHSEGEGGRARQPQEAGAGASSGKEAGGAGGGRRRYLTPTEIRRRELEAAGAPRFEEWAGRKRAEDERRLRERRVSGAAAGWGVVDSGPGGGPSGRALAPHHPTPRPAQEAAAAAARAKRGAAAARGDRAVAHAVLEHGWPSRVVEPFPRGTFPGRG
jgi:hypothetical protein